LWVGWNGGLAVKLKSANFESFTSYTELPLGNDISAIKAGYSTEGIWVGAASALIPPPTGGLMYLQSGAWEATEITGTINDIQTIDSEVWMGKQNGLYKVTKSGYTVYNTGNSYLPHNFINAITGDNNNTIIWIGTYGGGVARFKFK
jgi:ligand-binding sensor domain-containing protein